MKLVFNVSQHFILDSAVMETVDASEEMGPFEETSPGSTVTQTDLVHLSKLNIMIY